MTFFRKYREALLGALAVVGATLIINSDRLFTDERPLRWSKEYPLTGQPSNFRETMEQASDDAFEQMNGSWFRGDRRPVRLVKVELRGPKP